MVKDFLRGKPKMVRALSAADEAVFSMAVVVDGGVIEGVPYWYECIERDADGAIHATQNAALPWRGAFYNYLNADWMNLPRVSHARAVVGPFVDIDKYLLTLSFPLLLGGRFIGVIAADIRLDDFERILAPLLSKAIGDCAVLNGENRVLVSNAATFPVGELVDLAKLKKKRYPCGDEGWYVGIA
ncbi:conserved hypothetical protein [Ricinus communis]|uniref:Cache domain-containing protein n=1 Tax=Ricinus communis TaxID=3988 RepID=B9TDV0_RICCO|nr:conserved hypothetical protein [Ricinus communis]